MAILESILLVLVFLVGMTIIVSTIKTGISPMPSSKKAYLAMMTLVDKTDSGPIYDLGSGWGNLVIRLALRYPERQIVGFELSFFPWLVSWLLKRCLKLNNLTLYRKDFMNADLSQTSVITCYLFSDVMQKLKDKIEQEARPCCVISNNFMLPSYKANETIQLDDFYKSPVYFYIIE